MHQPPKFDVTRLVERVIPPLTPTSMSVQMPLYGLGMCLLSITASLRILMFLPSFKDQNDISPLGI